MTRRDLVVRIAIDLALAVALCAAFTYFVGDRPRGFLSFVEQTLGAGACLWIVFASLADARTAVEEHDADR